MLIEFSIANFLSFKDLKTLSLVAGSIKELKDDNAFKATEKLVLLKSAALYGANASGKSNFLEALKFFRNFIVNSARESQASDPIPVRRFRLAVESEQQPAHFEIIFLHEGIRYRYGFEVDNAIVHKEWLFFVPHKMESELFTRQKQEFHIGTHFRKEAKGVTEKTRENALLLSTAAQWNGEIAKKIVSWFKMSLNVISGLQDADYKSDTIARCEEAGFKKKILELLRLADLGIKDFDVESPVPGNQRIKVSVVADSFTPECTASVIVAEDNSQNKYYKPFNDMYYQYPGVDFPIDTNIITIHNRYDKDFNNISQVKFDLDKNESEGTKKFFALTGPVLDALANGSVLIVDELDTKLHPLLTQAILKLFNSIQTNPHNAQLVFAAHDTNILNRQFLRRDQIWFTEKDEYGASDLYCLLDFKEDNFKKVRNDALYRKDYILGKYGAIPFVGDLTGLLNKIED